VSVQERIATSAKALPPCPALGDSRRMRLLLVPALMFLTSAIMALAWLGHLRFRNEIGFWTALGASWLLVLPEYVLNVAATRYGFGAYSGAQMASLHLAFGVICVALVSRLVLGEHLGARQLMGFALLAVAIILITYRR
jgi:uncharacterized protein (DUF486 family)